MELNVKLSREQAKKFAKEFSAILFELRLDENYDDVSVRIRYRERILTLLESYGIDREHSDVPGLNKALGLNDESEVLCDEE